ncbi:hypothetical protein K9L67_03650 [Candidatus Woesearchaeota archaeon]|nr:hypothetical protein [Candidatus Woesearchaeota archaeon]MCF7901296.1 hypothetical protein [Candidatus Woesearchaeota archaeon]MCF8013798.1 hypothetical protein [Candidatus Woesearchaeota archaeon]
MINKKNAQMEIMGLLVIVILVIVGLLLILTFDTKENKQKSESTKFSYEQLTGTFGSTFMETTAPCNEIMRDMISDCAFSKEIICEQEESCEYITYTLEEIANKTLGLAGINHTIKISSNTNESIIIINNTGCIEGNSITKTTPIATSYEPIRLDLIICK